MLIKAFFSFFRKCRPCSCGDCFSQNSRLTPELFLCVNWAHTLTLGTRATEGRRIKGKPVCLKGGFTEHWRFVSTESYVKSGTREWEHGCHRKWAEEKVKAYKKKKIIHNSQVIYYFSGKRYVTTAVYEGQKNLNTCRARVLITSQPGSVIQLLGWAHLLKARVGNPVKQSNTKICNRYIPPPPIALLVKTHMNALCLTTARNPLYCDLLSKLLAVKTSRSVSDRQVS